jgi:hypothetical protein
VKKPACAAVKREEEEDRGNCEAAAMNVDQRRGVYIIASAMVVFLIALLLKLLVWT